MKSLIEYVGFLEAATKLGISRFTDSDDSLWELSEYEGWKFFTMPGTHIEVRLREQDPRVIPFG